MAVLGLPTEAQYEWGTGPQAFYDGSPTVQGPLRAEYQFMAKEIRIFWQSAPTEPDITQLRFYIFKDGYELADQVYRSPEYGIPTLLDQWTAYPITTPFLISRDEVYYMGGFSAQFAGNVNYFQYRIYDFNITIRRSANPVAGYPTWPASWPGTASSNDMGWMNWFIAGDRKKYPFPGGQPSYRALPF